MSKGITAERELISHLSALVEHEEALTMVKDYKKEVIEEFSEKLKKNILDLQYPSHVDDEIFEVINNTKWDEVK